MSWDHVNAVSLRRQHASDLRVNPRQIGDVLQHVRREDDVEAGVRQGDGLAVVVLDREDAMARVIRIGDFDRGHGEATPL